MRRREQGFTIIEVMIAALVILAALGVVVTTAAGVRHMATTASSKAAATKVAQAELDRLTSLGWDRLNMDAAPTPDSSNPKSPLYTSYLNGTTYQPSSDAQPQPLVIGTAPNAGDPDLRDVSSTPTAWSAGNGQERGFIYRFVTYGDDPSTTTTTQDYKRVSVAVTVTAPVNAITQPVVLSTEVANPTDTKTTSTSSSTAPVQNNYLTFYLYDTQASVGARVDPSADHRKVDTHAKPNLMDVDPPPDPNTDPDNPTTIVPTYDYSSDLTSAATFGRTIRKSANCNKYDTDHVMYWVSPTVSSNTKLTGNAIADLYMQTADGNSHAGTVCVSVWDVPGTLKADGSINGADSQIGTTQSATLNPFYTSYDDLSFTFNFLGAGATYYPITPGRRVGIKITVNDGGPAYSDLNLMYDHPDYPSAVGLETTP